MLDHQFLVVMSAATAVYTAGKYTVDVEQCGSKDMVGLGMVHNDIQTLSGGPVYRLSLLGDRWGKEWSFGAYPQ
jgi:hypothetical protein